MADERSSRFGGNDSDFWGDSELVMPAEPASLVGTTVGHIRLERLLGSGGMGDVYRGFLLLSLAPRRADRRAPSSKAS